MYTCTKIYAMINLKNKMKYRNRLVNLIIYKINGNMFLNQMRSNKYYLKDLLNKKG